MAAATADREVSSRQPGVIVAYTGNSSSPFYVGAMSMKGAAGAFIYPMVQGAGASNARFLGVNRNKLVFNSTGASTNILDVYKEGIFTFNANGTGVSADIGLRAFAIDDQTVGTSSAVPCIPVGEIVGLPTTTSYRVRITGFTGQPMTSLGMGASWSTPQN